MTSSSCSSSRPAPRSFTNGFHDTAEVIATSISTKALPRLRRIGRDPDLRRGVHAPGRGDDRRRHGRGGRGDAGGRALGLIRGLAWNLLTWCYGLPASSSHALIDGLVGSTIAAAGTDAVIADGVFGKFLIPGVAPIAALVVSALAILAAYRIVGRLRPGTRDARVSARPDGVGRAARARARHQRRAEDDGRNHARAGRRREPVRRLRRPVLGRGLGRGRGGFGTYGGGWRIIRTMGMRIIIMDSVQGFSAQSSSAAVILASSYAGFPLSTACDLGWGDRGGRGRY